MDKKEKMSDELLARYLSGKASVEEETAVLDYLAEKDENLDDFLNITASIELQKSKGKPNVYSKFWKKFGWSISAAAAVAALIIVSVWFFRYRNNEDVPLVQHNQTEQPSDTSSPLSSQDTSAPAADKLKSKQPPIENCLLPTILEPKQYADNATMSNYAKMLYPASPKILISQDERSMTFRWRTDACKVHLWVKSDTGKSLVNVPLTTETKFTLPLTDSMPNLIWKMNFTFSNGGVIEKSGEIMMATPQPITNRK